MPESSTLKIIFAGTPNFSVSSLQALIDSRKTKVAAVYTQPDRPAGRGKKHKPSPVKMLAQEYNIPVYQPQSFKHQETIDELAALNPDLIVVTAYGLILPQQVLDIPRLGCVNVHASLLPRWRGAAPIQRAIEAGDVLTGITLMQMEAGLDTGPVLATAKVPIASTDTGGSLHDKLSQAGGDLLLSSLTALSSSSLQPVMQDEQQATYANKLDRIESECRWAAPAEEIAQRIRAFNPWPAVTTTLGDAALKLLMASSDRTHCPAVPGMIISADKQGIRVATGEGVVVITELQKAGGKPMPVQAFLNGATVVAGSFFSIASTLSRLN